MMSKLKNHQMTVDEFNKLKTGTIRKQMYQINTTKRRNSNQNVAREKRLAFKNLKFVQIVTSHSTLKVLEKNFAPVTAH